MTMLDRATALLLALLYLLAAFRRWRTADLVPPLRKWYLLSIPLALVLSGVQWWVVFGGADTSWRRLLARTGAGMAIYVVWIQPEIVARQTARRTARTRG